MAATGSNDGEVPTGRLPVILFPTCLGDLMSPQTVVDATAGARGLRVRRRHGPRHHLLRAAGLQLRLRRRGAPRRAARRVRALARTTGPVVVPSGSCGAMMRVHWRELFHGDRDEELARDVAARVVEWSALVAERPLPAFAWQGRVAYHDSCHALRELRVKDAPRTLLQAVEGLEFVDLSSRRPLLRLRRHVLGPVSRRVGRDGRLQARRRRDGRASTRWSRRRRLPAAPGRAPVAHRLAGAHDPPRVAARGGAAVSDHLTGTTFEERAARAARQAVPAQGDPRRRRRHRRAPVATGSSTTTGRRCGASAATSARTPWRTSPVLVAAFAERARRPARTCTSPPTPPRRNRIVAGICAERRREARREVEVDAERGDRAQPGARGGRHRGGRDRPRRVRRAARRRPARATSSRRSSTRRRARCASCSRSSPATSSATTASRADGVRPRAAAREVPAGRRRHHRLQLRRRRDRHGRARHQRGQRAAVDVAAAGAHRPGGRRADRAAPRRPRRAGPAARRRAAPVRRSRPT